MRSGRTAPQRFWRTIAMLGFGTAAIITAALALSSLLRTNLAHLGSSPSERQVYGTLLDHPEWILPSFLAVAAVLLLLVGAERLGRRHCGLVVALSLAFVTLVHVIWIAVQLPLANNYFSDAYQLLKYASEVVSGNLKSFSPHSADPHQTQEGLSYLRSYPYQSGLLLMDAAFIQLFGSNCLLALAVCGSVLDLAAFCLVLRAARAMGERRLSPRELRSLVSCLATFGALCLPAYLYVTFPYGISIGLSLAIVFLCCGVRCCLASDVRKVVAWGAASALVMVPMVWVKSTFVLAVIALALAAVLRALMTRRWENLVLPVVLVAAYLLVSPLPQRYLERRVGYDFGEGLPRASWIAIGTSDGPLFGADGHGWWYRYALDLQTSTDNDYDEMTRLSSEQAMANIGRLISDPAYGLDFMRGKYASEWDDPTFESLYFVNLNIQVENSDQLGESQMFNPVDEGSFAGALMTYVLLPLMDGTQTVVYALASVALWGLARRSRPRRGDESIVGAAFPLSVAAVMFLEGFLVYTLWEAKSQYTLPFYVMLTTLAAFGFYLLRHRRGAFHGSATRRITPARHARR